MSVPAAAEQCDDGDVVATTTRPRLGAAAVWADMNNINILCVSRTDQPGRPVCDTDGRRELGELRFARPARGMTLDGGGALVLRCDR